MQKKKHIFSDWQTASALERVYLISTLILALCVVVTGICFAVSCVNVYNSAEAHPYSREVVAEHFASIAPITFICIAVTVITGIISIFVKSENKKSLPLSKKALLGIAERQLSSYGCTDEYEKQKAELASRRKVIILISCAVMLAFAVAAGIFVFNPAFYSSEDFNTDIAYASLITLASFAACVPVRCVAVYLIDRTYAEQTDLARAELKLAKDSGKVADPTLEELALIEKNQGHSALIVRGIVLTLAVIFIIAGVFNGGAADVLGKAVRICTECIGLG